MNTLQDRIAAILSGYFSSAERFEDEHLAAAKEILDEIQKWDVAVMTEEYPPMSAGPPESFGARDFAALVPREHTAAFIEMIRKIPRNYRIRFLRPSYLEAEYSSEPNAEAEPGRKEDYGN